MIVKLSAEYISECQNHSFQPYQITTVHSHSIILLVRCWIILGWAWTSSKMHIECPRRYYSTVSPLWVQQYGLSFTVKPWTSREIHAMYERSCLARTWSQRTPCCLTATCSLPCRAIVRLVPWFRKWVAMCAVNAFNLNCLCSCSLSCQPCSLAVALHAHSHGLAEVHKRRHVHCFVVKYLNVLI